MWFGDNSPNKSPKGQGRKQPSCCTPTPHSPNQSRKLGGTARGGVQECAGSPLLKRSSLLGSNLPHTPANKHIHTHTHTHTTLQKIGCMRRWKSAATQQDVHWVFCFRCSLRLRRPLGLPVDMTYSQTSPTVFTELLHALKDSWRPHLDHHHHLCSMSLTHCRAFGGSSEEMSSTFSFPAKE